MSSTTGPETQLTTITPRVKRCLLTISTSIFIILITLSLFSFDAKDVPIISGGVESYIIENWVGWLGAKISWLFISSIGLVSYPLFLLLLACTLRHLFGKVHSFDWVYLAAILCLVLGLCAFVGARPDFMESFSNSRNISTTPAGAVGSRLAHPKYGIMSVLLNQTGSNILSVGFILIGVSIIWLYDWQHFFMKNVLGKSPQKIKKEEPASIEDIGYDDFDNDAGDVFESEKSSPAVKIDHRDQAKSNSKSEPKKIKEDTDSQSLKDYQDYEEEETGFVNKTLSLVHNMTAVFPWKKVKNAKALNTIQRQSVANDFSQINNETDGEADDFLPAIAQQGDEDGILREKTAYEEAPRQSALKIKQEAPPAPSPAPTEKSPEASLAYNAPAENAQELNPEIEPEIEKSLEIESYSEEHDESEMSAVEKVIAARKYHLPQTKLISDVEENVTADPREIERKREILQDTLDSFRIKAETGGAVSGPRVTLFEVVPEKGVRVEKVTSIANNIAMELQASNVRILAPIPGKRSVGIEVPNDSESAVSFRKLLESKEFQNSKAQMPVALGKDIAAKSVIMDLAKAPHLLIAGATGAGKSVFMNTLILSLIYRFSPEEMQFIMVDPKVVEFSAYNSLPHLVCPVITDPQRVPSALRWAVHEMETRYQTLAAVGVKNLESFNNRKAKANAPTEDASGNKIPKKLPFIVIIIDELADLMMVAKADIETSIARIAQKARAVGIHLVIATQRPSVNVITGVIKANFPTRIAFQVTSNVDSKTILDRKGAEQLLGRGDMLFNPPGTSNLMRIQGAYVPDEDIDNVVEHCSKQSPQDFTDIFRSDEAADGNSSASPGVQGDLFPDMGGENEDEKLIRQAIEIIVKDKRASTSHIQRRLRIGYNRAALIMEALEERTIVGPQVGSAKREILIDESYLEGE